MIIFKNVTKKFDKFTALDNVNLTVKKGSIYGLIGTNGAGKSTIINHLSNLLIQDSGDISVDGESVFDNTNLKKRIGIIPDELYFYKGYSLKLMSKLYSKLYDTWNEERFNHMISLFDLDINKNINSFSKGMKKQAAFCLVMSTMPCYLILDEPIDGLDPIIRKLVWHFIIADVADRSLTVLVSSHNLKEMEGVCDSIGILSKGKMVLERDLEEMKSDMHKIQVAFHKEEEPDFMDLNILHHEIKGSVHMLIINDDETKVRAIIEKNNPVIFDLIPLTLDEIFIYELGGENDEINQIIY